MLTLILAFFAPLLLIGATLFCVSLSSYVPGLQMISQAIALGILQFLSTFGNGNSLAGIIVIALTCSVVAALFDTYAFYRYQILRGR